MIIVINKGRSLAGAALYLLNDKRLPGEDVRTTKERIAWTHALNTLEDDPERVVREMQYTVYNQEFIRRQAGHTRGGRPTDISTMTVSLSWEPSQRPDKEQMIAAAKSFVDYMGIGEHQVLLIAHNDTAHPHLHLLVNRIHPTTGMAMNQKWDWVRASRWGLAYERDHGKVLCHVRELKHDRGARIDGQTMPYSQWKMWQDMMREGTINPEHTAALRSGEWDTLKASQKNERLAFWKQSSDQRRQLRAAVREEVKAEFTPDWHAYAKHRDERKMAAARFDQETRSAMKHYRRHGPLHGIGAIQELKERQNAYHAQMRQDLFLQRTAISERMKQRFDALITPTLEKHNLDRAQRYKTVLAGQGGDRHQLHRDQAASARRPDLLSGYAANENQGEMLSVEQIRAYKQHGLDVAAQRAQYAQARGEIGQPPVRQDNRPPNAGDQRRATTEQTDAKRAQFEKDRDRILREAFARDQAAQRTPGRDRGGGGRDR